MTSPSWADDEPIGDVVVRQAPGDEDCFKLFAAVDQGPRSPHVQDLSELRPSRDELVAAGRWTLTHDPSREIADAGSLTLACVHAIDPLPQEFLEGQAGLFVAVAALLQIANTGEVQAAETLFFASSLLATVWAFAVGVLAWRASRATDGVRAPGPLPAH